MLAAWTGLALDGELWVGTGQDDGSKSPSVSNLSLARDSELRLLAVEDKWRCGKEEDNVQAKVGDNSTSVSKELTGDLKKDMGRATDLGEEGNG